MEELGWANFTNGEMVKGNEFLFGDYSVDQFAWKLEGVNVLPVPINAKGQLGLWNYDFSEDSVRKVFC